MLLPTKYRGDAVIDGERMSAELHLDADSIRLALEPNQEILEWPILSLEVAAKSRGTYELRYGTESFIFEPNVDDGLGEEISLRRRFATGLDDQPVFGPASPALQAPAERPNPIAQRVEAAGRKRRSLSYVRRAAPSLRSMVFGLGALLLVTALAVGLSLAFDGDARAGMDTTAQTPEVAGVTVTAPEPTADTAPAPQPPVVSTAPPPTTQPTTTTTEPSPTTTEPPTTEPPTTVTTEPTSTSVDLAASVWDMTPEQLAERWDALARPLSSTLMSTDLQVGDGRFSFAAGLFVRIQGETSDGRVRSVSFLGDPSGTVADDREVLTALGITVGVVEPRLPPEGRRELVSALGLDVDAPVLDDLDGSLEYLGNRYSLRFDPEALLIVFRVEPAG